MKKLAGGMNGEYIRSERTRVGGAACSVGAKNSVRVGVPCYRATTGVVSTSFPHLSQKVAYIGICDLQF